MKKHQDMRLRKLSSPFIGFPFRKAPFPRIAVKSYTLQTHILYFTQQAILLKQNFGQNQNEGMHKISSLPLINMAMPKSESTCAKEEENN